MHASAFTYNGTGVLTTGWSKGGKTETLLAFMSRGAEYIGDEWVYISADGQHMCGIPEPIRVWDWHLQELPQYRELLSSGNRTRLRAIKLAQAMGQTASKGPGRELFLGKAMKRMQLFLKQQLYVDVHPQRLFGTSSSHLSGRLRKVFFAVSRESPDISVQPIDAREIAERMVFSLQYERLNFMGYYLAFRFAFPEIRNEFIEQAEELQRERLAKMLADKDAYVVYHPYPVPIPGLFSALSPLL